MKEEEYISIWGRASIGGVKTSLLPARLLVEHDCIKLQAFLGTYYFPKEFVFSIKNESNNKIAIRHVIYDYPAEIVFSGEDIARRIQKTRFSASINTQSYKKTAPDSNPLKAWVFIALFLLWYVQRLFQSLFLWEDGGEASLIVTVAINLLFCTSLLFSKELQKMTLKPERKFADIRCTTFAFSIGYLLLLIWIILAPSLCEKYWFLCEPNN